MIVALLSGCGAVSWRSTGFGIIAVAKDEPKVDSVKSMRSYSPFRTIFYSLITARRFAQMRMRALSALLSE